MGDHEWHRPVTLVGRHVWLEPLAERHVPGLLEAAQEDEVWRWLPTPRPRSSAAMREWVGQALAEQARGERVPWTIVDLRAGDGAGVVAGSTSYLDIVPTHRRVEIGWTWLGRSWWRTSVNTECKLLLMTRAFDELGALRVSLKTDASNVRSQAAIAGLGGVREGVLRRHHVRPDGTSRDTVYFSVLADEWPEVRERLRTRLGT